MYIPSSKNALVKDHYQNLGFEELNENNFQLQVSNYTKQDFFIND